MAESDESVIDLEFPEVETPETEPENLPVERPRGFAPELAQTILAKVADGATLREIAKLPGMPTKSTIQRWIMKYPELAQAWKVAREMSASSFEDEALDMARQLKNQTDWTGTKVRSHEVAMAQFRWSASHRDPAQFGQTATPQIVVPVQINTTLDLGQPGAEKAAATLSTTYDIAAKFAKDYTAQDEKIEGTDDTMEPGAGVEAETDVLDFDLPEQPKPLAIRAKPRSVGGRPKKGHKTAAQTQAAITRRANRLKKGGA